MHPSYRRKLIAASAVACLIATNAHAEGVMDWLSSLFQSQNTQQAPREIGPPKIPENFYATPPSEKPEPLAPATLAFPETIDFGAINFNQIDHAIREIPFTNTGEQDLDNLEYGFSGDGVFEIQEPCTTIRAGGSCRLVVKFLPDDVGDFEAKLIIASGIGISRLTLTGNAFVPPPPVPLPKQEDNALTAMEAWRAKRLEERNKQGPTSKQPDQATRRVPPPRYKTRDVDYSREETPSITSSYPVDRTHIITMSRWIPLKVKAEVNSQFPGIIHFQLSENIYGTDGKSLLGEKGDVLLGKFEPLEIGNTRLNVCIFRWERLVDGAQVYDAKDECFGYATDKMMRVGLVGQIDNRWLETYGSALAVTGIATASVYGTTALSTSEEITQSGTTLKDQFAEITAKMLERGADLRPIITVSAGEGAGLQLLKDVYIRRPALEE